MLESYAEDPQLERLYKVEDVISKPHPPRTVEFFFDQLEGSIDVANEFGEYCFTFKSSLFEKDDLSGRTISISINPMTGELKVYHFDPQLKKPLQGKSTEEILDEMMYCYVQCATSTIGEDWGDGPLSRL